MKDQLAGAMAYAGKILKTSDGGETWSDQDLVQPPVGPANSYGKGTLMVIGDTLFIAAQNSGMIYSPDFGQTWVQPANSGLSFSSPGKIHFTDMQFGLAINGSMPFVYLTTNGGNSWNIVDNSLGANEDVLAIGRQCWYIPNSADHFYVKYSDDQGLTWTQQLNDPDGFDVLERSRVGHTLWTGSDKGKVYTYYLPLSTGIQSPMAMPGKFKVTAEALNGNFGVEIHVKASSYSIAIFDQNGKQISESYSREPFIVVGAELTSGLYILQVMADGQKIGSQKVLKI